MSNNIGRILQDLLRADRTAKHTTESPTERYSRIVIPLDSTDYVGTDIEIHVKGDYLGKVRYDGDATAYIKLNHRHSGKIYCREFRRTWSEYTKIYLTNPAVQAGKQFIMNVGGAFSGEIEPSTGAKTVLTDSTGENDINPATSDAQATMETDIEAVQTEVEKRHITHTFFYNKLKTQTAGTAQKVAAASQKVKWAVISVQKDAVFGDSDVEVMGNADQGLPIPADGYLTVEYIDLTDLWIIDQAGVNVPYTVIGVLEA